ncbi:2'-5'-oligoadenylate synthase-like protein isoform X2 [Ursus maritimus]|uniref:2'-5'-oligoadenylate synthase-like protein isoform X2 n=1 Tax=Ursus maritimus TaxID=29073 RepID=A0A8M1EY12_URSMA|nr:2'-5'-oligoadenylate synthase-like protein isoform X2 [Ursus maritimus]
MALTMELYATPASRLDSFVAQWLQPCREQKEEVLEAVWTVQQFLREECFEGDCGLDQEVRALRVLKVGSFGNGTALRNTLEVELVVFLSCFHSFQQEAKHHQAILSLIWKKLWYCRDLLALGLEDVEIVQGVPDAVVFTIQTRRTAEPITVTIVPAYRALGPSVSNTQPHPEVYVSLIEAHGYPGNFSPSFSELQRNFVKHRPTKLKSLLRYKRSWGLSCLFQQYVKARCPRAALPPDYALELLTIYAWEMGTQEDKSFGLDEGFTTVMELLREYKFLCIYWTKYYTFQNPVIKDFVRKQLKRDRPIILDPADPTHNVAEGYRWDIVAQRASQCLKQNCCYDNKENPVPSWNVKRARDIQVTVEQWGHSELIFRVNPYEPIKKVQEKIWQSRSSLSVQQLSFQEPGGKRQFLNTQCSLASYSIFSNIRLCLMETFSSEIQVFVKNPDGGSHTYALDPKSFILGLKQQIEDKQGLPRKQQQLEFQGQVLQDWLSLCSYGIQDRDTLILSKKKAERFPFPPS